MAVPSPRRSWVLSALALLALAHSTRAAGAADGKTRRTESAVEGLKGDIGRPDDFQRFVDGSRAGRGDVDAAPGADARSGERGALAAPLLSAPRANLRPEGTSVPPTVAGAENAPAGAARRIVWFPGLRARKLAAVLGLGFMLIAGSMLETPVEIEIAPELEEFPAAPSLPRAAPSPLLPPEPSLAPSRLADALAEPSFIDTRMPVPTWRAITQREQILIERWDASREKSSGRASLADWIDARGRAEGVDAPLLKAKLRLEA